MRRIILYFAMLLVLASLLLALMPSQAQDATPLPPPTATIVPTPIVRPAPYTSVTQDGVTLEVLFASVAQGQVSLLRLTGANIGGARLNFLDKLVEFFAVEGDGFFALLSINMDQAPGTYPLEVYADVDAETRITLATEIQVAQGQFIRQDVTVNPDRAYLVDTQIERNEFARLASLYNNFTLARYWQGGAMQYPIPSVTTSPFGSFRVFNDTLTTRHTGWDMRAPVGTPVMTMAPGVVVFAGLMDIRGNYVFIDHGYGVYSGYAHFSQIHVTRGQEVMAGQIIGVSGDTGRSNGPHLHWEMTVNGEWVDTVQWMSIWLP